MDNNHHGLEIEILVKSLLNSERMHQKFYIRSFSPTCYTVIRPRITHRKSTTEYNSTIYIYVYIKCI